jgi:hypothetical protein
MNKASRLYLGTNNSGLRGKLINMYSYEDILLTIQENFEILT